MSSETSNLIQFYNSCHPTSIFVPQNKKVLINFLDHATYVISRILEYDYDFLARTDRL